MHCTAHHIDKIYIALAKHLKKEIETLWLQTLVVENEFEIESGHTVTKSRYDRGRGQLAAKETNIVDQFPCDFFDRKSQCVSWSWYDFFFIYWLFNHFFWLSLWDDFTV